MLQDRSIPIPGTPGKDGSPKLSRGVAGQPCSPIVDDVFSRRLSPGSVVGTASPGGVPRLVVDIERVISADNGALRIQPLIEPGWGRAGVAYGPHARANGLAFAVSVLNGHNTAQAENLTETFRARLDRWLVGPEVHRRRQRLAQWLRSQRKSRMFRQWRWWWRARKDARPVLRIDENLALGWYGDERPADPLRQGNGFVMHATGAENGELWARVGDSMLPAVRGVQNLPIHYVVVLRERGAAYYVASLTGAKGLGDYPALRLVAIDPFNTEPTVYAGLFQSTLGQIGFRLDTRVYGLRVARAPGWSAWYGSAHGADLLTGRGALTAAAAELGGHWQQRSGKFERSDRGTRAAADDSVALLPLARPCGLLHFLVDCASACDTAVGIIWRCADPDNYWQLTLSATSCVLAIREHGRWTALATDETHGLHAGTLHSVQILDDGRGISLYLNGTLLFDRRFDDERFQAASGIGVAADRASDLIHLSRLEVHPRSCPLPEALDQGAPWWRLGTQSAITDEFEGDARDLADKVTTTGGNIWQRTMGTGHIEVTGVGSAKVHADANQPNPGRLAYTVNWAHAEFADLEVEITPPGSMRGQREHGRAGLVFWQDDENFILVNNWLNDTYGGASVSFFSCLGGFEDLYDAVWTNVGERIRWGAPHRFRIAFDGMNLLALVDDEPVLYRALTDIYADAPRLQIRRVGLVANWEWGNDTGSTFQCFHARV